MQLFILLSFQHCDKRFLTSVWKHVKKQRPQASQSAENDFSLLGQPGGGAGGGGGWRDWVLFALSRGWSCRSHQVKQVAGCQVIEPFTQTWGGIDTVREAKTSALRATHIYNWNRRGSMNSLHQTEKPEGVCVCVFKAFRLHWPNKHICTPMEICYKHTIARQFLLVQYEKKFTSLASCAVCYVSSNCWE